MRAILFSLAALCAQVGLSIPHGDQQHKHHARELATTYSTLTDVVTVTARNAVIWVDQNNNVLSTEYRDGQGSPSHASFITSTSSSTFISTSTSSQTTSSSSGTGLPLASISNLSPGWSSTPNPITTAASLAVATSALLTTTTTGGSFTVTSAASSDSSTSVPVNKGTSDKDSHSAGSGYGICHELYDSNGCKNSATLNSEFSFLASQGFSKVRVYDIGCDVGAAVAAAAVSGIQLIAGLNTISNVAADVGTLVSMINGNWGPVDTIVIGNEVVNHGGDPGAVVAALAVARPILAAAGFTKSIVTVDTFVAHLNHPELCLNSDYCAVNAHAFFDPNTSADEAGSFVTTAIASIGSNAGGKRVIVTESGWPYQGEPNGNAIPSLENQRAAITSLKSAFAGNPGDLFLFQSYDATYKVPGYLGVEQFFGIFGHS